MCLDEHLRELKANCRGCRSAEELANRRSHSQAILKKTNPLDAAWNSKPWPASDQCHRRFLSRKIPNRSRLAVWTRTSKAIDRANRSGFDGYREYRPAGSLHV